MEWHYGMVTAQIQFDLDIVILQNMQLSAVLRKEETSIF